MVICCLSLALAPTLHWRTQAKGRFSQVKMRPSEHGGWYAPVAHPRVQFYLKDGKRRAPLKGHWVASSPEVYVQHGQIYTYRPALHLEPARRDYHPSRPMEYESAVLGERRRIRVYLPRGYRQHPSQRYPVVYMNDGQNIFERGAFGSWSADRRLDELVARGETRELIVVAVDHGPGRFHDYAPPEDGGRADRYARFLADELKPSIDRHYRTLPDSFHTAVVGSSLGGVCALYVAWNRPDVFGKAASLSGSWFLRRWRDRLPWHGKRPLQCYIDSGDSGPARDGFRHTMALSGVLTSVGYRHGHDLLHYVARGHRHNESAWGKRLAHPLRFFFPAS